jgi:uncharacterized protein (DUF2235 family)
LVDGLRTGLLPQQIHKRQLRSSISFDGEEIFIFGFSRGACAACSLSGLICKCGVPKLGAPLSIEQLYARYRIYGASTIRSLTAKPLPQDASIEEQWPTKYSRPTKIKFVGVWDTVGSPGLPVASAAGKVHKYRFLDTHLRLDNEFAFHALALDEHRHNFEPTFWTRTIKAGEGALRIVRSNRWSSAGLSARMPTSAEDTFNFGCRHRLACPFLIQTFSPTQIP